MNSTESFVGSCVSQNFCSFSRFSCFLLSYGVIVIVLGESVVMEIGMFVWSQGCDLRTESGIVSWPRSRRIVICLFFIFSEYQKMRK